MVLSNPSTPANPYPATRIAIPKSIALALHLEPGAVIEWSIGQVDGVVVLIAKPDGVHPSLAKHDTGKVRP